MKNLLLLFLLFVLTNCNSENKQKETKEKQTEQTPKKVIAQKADKKQKTKESFKLKSEADNVLNDTIVVAQYKRLIKKFPIIPYFTKIDTAVYFYVGDKPSNTYGEKRLYAYGYHLELIPEYDYFLPAKEKSKAVAIGVKGNEQYDIFFDGYKFTAKPIDYDFREVFSQIRLNITNPRYSFYYTTSFKQLLQDDPIEGRGALITPSFQEVQLKMQSVYENIVVLGQNDFDFGTNSLEMKTQKTKTISEKISSFFVEFWHSGVDARDFVSNSVDMLVYNSDKKEFSHKNLLNYSESGEVCNTNEVFLKNDSIVEVVKTASYLNYNWAPKYSYLRISEDGVIEELKGNRIFPFTKFVKIDENYFTGCFARYLKEVEMTEDAVYNIMTYQHFSIEDLDIMRNEIFAEYGYKFKTEKWRNYFGQFDWYEPAFDNVDDKLSELEKENIKVILKRKAEMKGKEDEFLKQEKSTYVAAG